MANFSQRRRRQKKSVNAAGCSPGLQVGPSLASQQPDSGAIELDYDDNSAGHNNPNDDLNEHGMSAIEVMQIKDMIQRRIDEQEVEQQSSDEMRSDTSDDGSNFPNEHEALPNAYLPMLQLAHKLIDNIKGATLKDDIIDEDLLHSLHYPETEIPELDHLTMLVLKIFTALIAGSQQMYNDV